MTEHEEGPRIYVASLSDYNAGRLHGAWIDAATDPDTIRVDIAEMLGTSRYEDAEEWAIHDHEGFHGLPVGEYESLDRICEWATAIVEHGPAFAAYVAHLGAEYATAEGFEEDYQGEHESEEDYAQELADDIGAVPDELPWPLSYIDWERAARDLFMGDYWSADSPSGVYVFRAS